MLLGVTVTASEKEIKDAYKKLALKYHPDKNKGDLNAESIFKRIGVAQSTLCNSTERKLYDMYGCGPLSKEELEFCDNYGSPDPYSVFVKYVAYRKRVRMDEYKGRANLEPGTRVHIAQGAGRILGYSSENNGFTVEVDGSKYEVVRAEITQILEVTLQDLSSAKEINGETATIVHRTADGSKYCVELKCGRKLMVKKTNVLLAGGTKITYNGRRGIIAKAKAGKYLVSVDGRHGATESMLVPMEDVWI